MRLGHIARDQGNVGGLEVKWSIPILKIEDCSAVVVIQVPLFEHDMAGFEAKQSFDRRLT